ncbi:hypothetical protein CMI40_02790 [Candidatus Pacearchaeota archaeon]|jgi:Icc-related predicted phosphoesterase|nr:hypothetical protein [Candidatus Pacearchaeota archaeon]|tara:strand:+ start:2200 stop:2805 length:606 start_codon:yes stop_codon:yes gene_type:complete
MKKTKVLAIGDIHGDTGLVKRLAKKAKKENVDLVILSGDLTYMVDELPKDLIGPFLKVKKPVLLLHGNHESLATADFLTEMYPNTKNIHGYSFKKDNLGIFGAGGALKFNTSEKEILKSLEKGHLPIKDSKKKIMVTHMHVKGTKSEFSGWEGSKSIRKAINKFKPDIVIHSHIHEAKGFEEKIGKTRVINVAKKEKIFEI